MQVEWLWEWVLGVPQRMTAYWQTGGMSPPPSPLLHFDYAQWPGGGWIDNIYIALGMELRGSAIHAEWQGYKVDLNLILGLDRWGPRFRGDGLAIGFVDLVAVVHGHFFEEFGGCFLSCFDFGVDFVDIAEVDI